MLLLVLGGERGVIVGHGIVAIVICSPGLVEFCEVEVILNNKSDVQSIAMTIHKQTPIFCIFEA